MSTEPEPRPDQVSHLRRDYQQGYLDENQVLDDPIKQFQVWFTEALQASVEPNAMTLATSTPDGYPSARIVLLKGLDERGFVFFSNYDSRKGQELDANPRASLVFYWAPLERQVRVSGEVTKVSREESATYFHSRPRGSQLSACISNQSQPVTRAQLEAEWQTLDEAYADQQIPLPANWGGYRLKPDEVEFWQGRKSRLHDRLVYRGGEAGWTIVRLAP